jgi:hypothetical protein
MRNTILGALAILAALFAVWALYKPHDSTRSGELSPAFAAYRDSNFDSATRITIAKGKGAPVELKKAGGKWVVASSYGYPADGEKIDKILKGLGEINSGERRGSGVPEEYEVDDKKGVAITAFTDDGKSLGKLVVGKNVAGGGISTTFVFVRFGDDPTTYAVESGIRSEASLYNKEVEGKSYLLKKVVSIPDEMEVESARVTRPDKPDLLVERKWKEVPVEKPKDAAEPKKEADPADAASAEEKKDGKKDEKAEEKKPETKKEEYFVATSASDTKDVGKSEEYSVRGFLNNHKDLTIDDAVEPKDLAEYGLDKPQLKGTITYRKKDAPDSELKTLTILFGNAKKDEKGENKGYYAAVDSDAEKGRIYLIQTYTFDSWNKEMKDFLPKPKEEEKPKTDATAPPAVPPAPGSPAPVAPGPVIPPPPGPAPQGAPTTSAPVPPPVPATPQSPPAPAPAPGPKTDAPKDEAPKTPGK